MIIDKDNPLGPFVVVIKDNAPLGLCQWIDTKKKRYSRVLYPGTSTEEGNYDRAVVSIDEMVTGVTEKRTMRRLCLDNGVEPLNQEEIDQLRKEIGVRL